MVQSLVARNMIMKDDPLLSWMKGVVEAREMGREQLEGIETTIVELAKLSIPWSRAWLN